MWQNVPNYTLIFDQMAFDCCYYFEDLSPWSWIREQFELRTGCQMSSAGQTFQPNEVKTSSWRLAAKLEINEIFYIFWAFSKWALQLLAGHWANKNSFIFIYCFTFPRGHRDVAITAEKKLTRQARGRTGKNHGKNFISVAVESLKNIYILAFFCCSILEPTVELEFYLLFLLPRRVHNSVDLSCGL